MSQAVYCPVCRINFKPKEEIVPGAVLLCRICGAKVEVIQVEPEVKGRKYPQEPREEIFDRVNTFAELKGYVFKEMKELVMEGLLQKKEEHEDFYCPCRFENIPENICPCLETRQNQVKKDGQCL